MTYEEALFYLRNTSIGEVGYTYKPIKVEVLETAIEALEKAHKYRWHDLRKNPNDLPDPWEYVLIQTYKNESYVAQTDTVLHTWVLRDDEFDYCDIGSCMVIAWKEIEPFEVKNNDQD